MAKKKAKKTAKKEPKRNVNGQTINDEGKVIGKTGKVLGETPPELIPYGWKKGQSGNPKGRPPKEKVLTTYLKAQLNCLCSSVKKFAEYCKNYDLDPDETTIGELVSATLIDQMLTGGHFQMREIMNRVDGIQTSFDRDGDPDEFAMKMLHALSQIKAGKMQPPPVVKKDEVPDAEFEEKE